MNPIPSSPYQTAMSSRLIVLIILAVAATSALASSADVGIGGEQGQLRYEAPGDVHMQAKLSLKQEQHSITPARLCKAARGRTRPEDSNQCITEDDHCESDLPSELTPTACSVATENPLITDKSIYEFLRDDPQ